MKYQMRILQGWKLAALAERFGVGQSQVSRICLGQVRVHQEP